jgi:hypothetical protein
MDKISLKSQKMASFLLVALPRNRQKYQALDVPDTFI